MSAIGSSQYLGSHESRDHPMADAANCIMQDNRGYDLVPFCISNSATSLKSENPRSIDRSSGTSKPSKPSIAQMGSALAESTTVDSTDGVKLHGRHFKPSEPSPDNLAVVLVHPYSVLGGFQGLLRGIATGLAEKGYHAVTFDMRGAGRSTGRASLTGFAEVNDVVAVCKWVSETLKPAGIVLVGSSAGAPIAGSSVDKINEVVGYVSIGYPFGMMASILFGRHHQSILKSEKPKLFVMGTRDGFTSVKQLENKLKSSKGRTETRLIEGAGHFQMEGPDFDNNMVGLIVDFIKSVNKEKRGESSL